MELIINKSYVHNTLFCPSQLFNWHKQIHCHDFLITCNPNAFQRIPRDGEHMHILAISDGLKCMAMGHQHHVHDGSNLMKEKGPRKTCHAYNMIVNAKTLLTSTRY